MVAVAVVWPASLLAVVSVAIDCVITVGASVITVGTIVIAAVVPSDPISPGAEKDDSMTTSYRKVKHR